jgi:drug/metabolite transporter (DMT)-like permease
MTLRHPQAVALMVLVTALWSIAGVVTRQLSQAQSFEVTFWRSLFTALSLVVILPLWQGASVWQRIHWKSRVLWSSAVLWGVMFTAFMVALTLTTVANVLITMALGPFITALFARIFTGQRIAGRTWLAMCLAGVGIGGMYASDIGQFSRMALIGSAVALCVPTAGALQWTLAQKLRQTEGSLSAQDMVPAVMLGAMLSALVTLPLSTPFVATSADVAWLAVLGLFQLAIPCTLSVLAARVLAAPEVSLLALLEIIFGIALAWAFAGEVPSGAVLVGGALVIGALVLNEVVGLGQSSR